MGPRRRAAGPIEDGGSPWYLEATGHTVFVSAMLALGSALLWFWFTEYIVPVSQLLTAECLVISSKSESTPAGFQREPLHRALVKVYLFNATVPHPNCTEPAAVAGTSNSSSNTAESPAWAASLLPPVRCNEWQGTAYDTISGRHSPKEKMEFLTRWGHPGNFYPCLHSRDGETIVFETDWNLPFLTAPITAFIVAIYSAVKGGTRCCRWWSARSKRKAMSRSSAGYEEVERRTV